MLCYAFVVYEIITGFEFANAFCVQIVTEFTHISRKSVKVDVGIDFVKPETGKQCFVTLLQFTINNSFEICI